MKRIAVVTGDFKSVNFIEVTNAINAASDGSDTLLISTGDFTGIVRELYVYAMNIGWLTMSITKRHAYSQRRLFQCDRHIEIGDCPADEISCVLACSDHVVVIGDSPKIKTLLAKAVKFKIPITQVSSPS